MRRIRSVLYCACVAASAGGFAPAALAAGYVDACHRPPPAWYTAPRLTHTYSQSYGAGYARASTHEYSAQRRYSVSQPHRYHAAFGRW